MIAPTPPTQPDKPCPQCNKRPPAVEYNVRGYRSDGVSVLWKSWCRDCHKAYCRNRNRTHAKTYPRKVACECGTVYTAHTKHEFTRGCPTCCVVVARIGRHLDHTIEVQRATRDGSLAGEAVEPYRVAMWEREPSAY